MNVFVGSDSLRRVLQFVKFPVSVLGGRALIFPGGVNFIGKVFCGFPLVDEPQIGGSHDEGVCC